MDKMLELLLADMDEMDKSGKLSRVKSECEEVEPGEEELELRRRLRDWVLEKRNAKLPAALDRDVSSDEGEKWESRSRKKREK